MNKFKGMLMCTDLDGTLLGSDKRVSEENHEAIEYFKSEGGLFTFITGRPPIVTVDYYKEVKPNAPVGCINGGALYDFERDKYLWRCQLSSDYVDLIRAVDAAEEDIGVQIVTYDDVLFLKDNFAMERFRAITGTKLHKTEYTTLPTEVAKILFGEADIDKLMRIVDILKRHPKADQFDFIRSEKTLYEVLPKGISKATALIKLTELLGIDMKNTVAVGDYNNDIEMVRAAGLGVAVANAIPELKEVADRVTVSNNENAIARIIEEL